MNSPPKKQQINSIEEARPSIQSPSGTEYTASTRLNQHHEKSMIEAQISKIKRYTNSYYMVLWSLMLTGLLNGLGVLANQKYIQTVLSGEASDLATVDLFANIMSSVAPLFGYLMDVFYPFKIRIAPFLILAYLVGSLSLISIWAFPHSKTSFVIILSINAASTTFVTVITQALIVLKTKLDIQLFDEQENLREIEKNIVGQKRVSNLGSAALERMAKRDRIGIKLYTIYSVFNALFQGLSSVFSGFIVDNFDIHLFYLISAIPGICIILFVLIVLREPKEEKWFAEGQDLLLTIKSFFKVFFSPLIFLPAVLKLLTKMIPDVGEAIRFILINQGG